MFEKYNGDKLYPGSKKIIHEMVRRNIDEEVIKFATQLRENGLPVFFPEQMGQILLGIVNKLSFKDIKKYALIYNGKAVYDAEQMHVIREGMFLGLHEELINIYAKLNADMKPIYDKYQMDTIKRAMSYKIPMENIEIMCRLNKNGEPAYNWKQMNKIYVAHQVHLDKEEIEYLTKVNNLGNGIYSDDAMHCIINGFEKNMPVEYVNIYSRIKNEEPVFDDSSLIALYKHMAIYFEEGKYDKIDQIKECVDNELEFEKIEPFLNLEVSADTIRILRSFYDIDASIDDIKYLISENIPYKDLKEIKYLLKCTKEFNLFTNPVLDEKIDSIEEKRITLSNCIAALCGTDYEENKKFVELADKCLFYKMPPDQIKCIMESEKFFAADTALEIASRFFKGLKVEEFNTLLEKYKTNSSYTFEKMKKDMDKIINDKISPVFNFDESVDFTSDYDKSKEKDI